MLTCAPQNAQLFATWLATRGGIAVWKSINLSNPGASCSTPARTENGAPMQKPSWQYGNEPSIATNHADVVVEVPKEVKRFHVAVRMSSNGMQLKVTDGGSRRIRAAVEKAGPDAWYEFDYERQDAVIYVPEKTVPLKEYLNCEL